MHVRVLIEGAEETGSDDVGEWVRADERGADAVIVFDSGMVDADTPALTLATRGMVFAHVEVRTGTQPAHSGMYGGAALNAFHALHRRWPRSSPAPTAACPSRCGRASIAPSRGRARELDDAAGAARRAGRRSARARPTPGAVEEFYIRTTAEPSLDVHKVDGGAGADDRRAGRAPPTCRCGSSAGQRSEEIAADLERAAARRAARRRRADASAPTAPRRPRSTPRPPRCRPRGGRWRASRATTPTLVRTGGTLPMLAAFAERGIPAIVSGFALPDDACTRPTSPTGWCASSRAGARRARFTRSWRR